MILVALWWLLILELFAFAVFPLAYRVFSQMPDRGWAFSKPLGLLLVGFFTWLIGLTHTIPNSRWSVLLALVIVALLAWGASRGSMQDVRRFLRERGSAVLTGELLFIAAFLGMTLFRASVTDIGATEQPMDFMFLNSVVTSEFYPPIDPWLSGETVSYYYLGYLMNGAVAMLSGIATPVAYNLGLATAAAMGAIAAFGVTYNLVRLAHGSEDGAVYAGLASAFLLLIASNLVGGLELVRAAGVGGEGFWAALGIEGYSAPSGPSSSWRPNETHLWWWRASRVVPPGHINEFPLFSFLVGDMHPHVMSMGFVLLTVGVSIQIYLQQGLLRLRRAITPQIITVALINAILILVTLVTDVSLLWVLPVMVIGSTAFLGSLWPLGIVIIITTGALAAINLWDLPLAFALTAGALLLGTARNERQFGFGRAVAIADGVVVMGAPSDSTLEPRGGAAHIYTLADPDKPESWQRRVSLRPEAGTPNARFGTAVATGNGYVVVGAPGVQQVFVYVEDDGAWWHRATLRPPEGQHLREFGRVVAVDDGVIAVGTLEAVFVYERAKDAPDWALAAKLSPSTPRSRFGAAISLREGTIAVGAPGANAAYIYRRGAARWALDDRLSAGAADAAESPSAGLAEFGQAISLGDDRLVVGARGAAYVFRYLAQTWEQEATLDSPTSTIEFGVACSIDHWYVAVGAEGGGPTRSKGMVTVFEYDNAVWTLHDTLTAADVAGDAFYASSLAMSGNLLIVGAAGKGHGAGYLYARALGDWRPTRKLVSRWRLGPAAAGVAVLVGGVLLAFTPFLWGSFDSNASGVIPLLSLITRPVHLLLLFGVPALLVLPLLGIALKGVFTRGSWDMKRASLSFFGGFTPIMFWLQPVYTLPLYAIAVGLFALNQAGFRMQSADETTFGYNPRATLAVGGSTVVLGFLIHGIFNAERGTNGELLAMDRLLVTVPMAIVLSLAIYGAWTLAHRDSEVLRTAGIGPSPRTRGDGLVPALGLLAIVAALVMGVELFHVADIFGGDYRRLNTMFKLHYQAWVLLSALGGFGLWFVTTRWNRRILRGRIGITIWSGVLVVALAAVSYYPLAAITSRAGASGGLDLDGQSHVARNAPSEFAAIQWVRDNTAHSAVVVEAAVVPCGNEPNGCHSYTDAARIASSTGRPTIIGWLGHERQWRNTRVWVDLDRRMNDVRTIFETTDAAEARRLLARYDADYVVVGPRERNAYGVQGEAKFAEIGEPMFTDATPGQELTVYRLFPSLEVDA
jgi:uncharacterized membrane protein